MLPVLGSIGSYTFASPFNTTSAGDSFTCESIRSISEMVNSGIDVYTTIYAANSLTETQYTTDLAADVYIVSLSCTNGVWLQIPNSYISAQPNVDGVIYASMTLGVSLDAIPVNTNLTALSSAISNVVADMYGITPSITPIQTSKTKIVSAANNTIIQNARLARITSNTTDTAKYLALQTKYDELLTQFQIQQQYLLSKKTILGL